MSATSLAGRLELQASVRRRSAGVWEAVSPGDLRASLEEVLNGSADPFGSRILILSPGTYNLRGATLTINTNLRIVAGTKSGSAEACTVQVDSVVVETGWSLTLDNVTLFGGGPAETPLVEVQRLGSFIASGHCALSRPNPGVVVQNNGLVNFRDDMAISSGSVTSGRPPVVLEFTTENVEFRAARLDVFGQCGDDEELIHITVPPVVQLVLLEVSQLGLYGGPLVVANTNGADEGFTTVRLNIHELVMRPSSSIAYSPVYILEGDGEQSTLFESYINHIKVLPLANGLPVIGTNHLICFGKVTNRLEAPGEESSCVDLQVGRVETGGVTYNGLFTPGGDDMITAQTVLV